MCKVTITWTWKDVKTLRPDWTEERCELALGSARKTLTDRSIELGWDILEDCLVFLPSSSAFDSEGDKQ